MIEIKNRRTGALMFSHEGYSVFDAIKAAVAAGVSMRGADLSKQEIGPGRIVGGDFADSTFDGSTFDGSSFDGSSFDDSTFDGSSFVRCSFDGSSFDDGTFDGSSFVRCSFDGSSFADSTFDDSSFVRCSFADVRDDLHSVLDAAPNEVPALLAALREGRVDGTVYEGACACLVGTIANARGCDYSKIEGIAPNLSRPAEHFFLGIGKGSTPANNPLAKIAEGWIEEWQAKHAAGAPNV